MVIDIVILRNTLIIKDLMSLVYILINLGKIINNNSSITSGPPCGEQNLGPSQKKWWINRLTTILGGNDNDTTVIIGSRQLVTGIDSVLGTSVLLTEKKEVFCGHFKPLTEKTIAVAKFSEPFSGYIKLVTYCFFLHR
uniref:Uncharacterized protein n=1 Tax=Heterorhabditis bacteriophora TaxID=37862 RepID=A0A1I7WHH8_HETBA